MNFAVYRLYINDDLTALRSRLVYELKRDAGVQKVWTIDGRIFCVQVENGHEVRKVVESAEVSFRCWLVGGAGGHAGSVPGVNSDQMYQCFNTRNTRLQWVILVVFVQKNFRLNAIYCNGCKLWTHRRCADLNTAELEYYSHVEDDWFCRHYISNNVSIYSDIR